MVGEKLYEEQAQLVSKDGKDLDPQSPDWLDNLDTDNMWHLQEVSDEDINMYYYVRNSSSESMDIVQAFIAFLFCFQS